MDILRILEEASASQRDQKPKLVCNVCGGLSFTLDGGFYYCDGCGEQAKDRRETEIEYAEGRLGAKLRKVKKRTAEGEEGRASRQRARALRADPHLCERALSHEGDFPRFLHSVGTRLCTATKLVAKLASALTDEPFRLPEQCVEFSQLLLFTYLRKAGIAFSDQEVTDDPAKMFCPLVKRTQEELKKLNYEREKRLKERREQRRKERVERSTIWEQLTQSQKIDPDEDDSGDQEAEPPINVIERFNTSLSEDALNMAGAIYLGIDLLLCMVFMASQMAGCQWVQSSDIFRWYREGRLTVSHSQLCALHFATPWHANPDKKGRQIAPGRQFFSRARHQGPFYGIQASTESFIVLSFLTQFVGIPKSIPTTPFQDVLSRLVYNLNLPKAFLRQLRALLAVLPPGPSTDYGALQLAKGVPMEENFLEQLRAAVRKDHKIGYVTFFRYALGKYQQEHCIKLDEHMAMLRDRRRHIDWNWLPFPCEVNAAALILFAMKLYFGLDGDREHEFGPGHGVDEADNNHDQAIFNFSHWFRQLQLRTHCWQGTAPRVVLGKSFSACQLERSNPEVPYRRPTLHGGSFALGGSRLFHRYRRQPFVGCVPNVLHNRVQPRLFENLFPNQCSSAVSASAYTPVSNEELFTPLQHQAQANLDLLEALKRHNSGEDGSAALGQLDKRNVDIFFRNFYESSLGQPPLESEEEQNSPLLRLFPSAKSYLKMPYPRLRPSRMRSIVAQPLRRQKWIRAIFAASEHLMSPTFRLLLRHLALCVSEWEELLYIAFLVIEEMFLNNSKMAPKHPEDDELLRSSESSSSSDEEQMEAADRRELLLDSSQSSADDEEEEEEDDEGED